jgi:hypothetical protein
VHQFSLSDLFNLCNDVISVSGLCTFVSPSYYYSVIFGYLCTSLIKGENKTANDANKNTQYKIANLWKSLFFISCATVRLFVVFSYNFFVFLFTVYHFSAIFGNFI